MYSGNRESFSWMADMLEEDEGGEWKSRKGREGLTLEGPGMMG